MSRYNEAAVLEMYMKVLPEVVRGVAEPLSKIDKIVMINSDKELGAAKVSSQVAQVLSQVPDVVQALTGADLKKYLRDKLSTEEKTAK